MEYRELGFWSYGEILPCLHTQSQATSATHDNYCVKQTKDHDTKMCGEKQSPQRLSCSPLETQPLPVNSEVMGRTETTILFISCNWRDPFLLDL